MQGPKRPPIKYREVIVERNLEDEEGVTFKLKSDIWDRNPAGCQFILAIRSLHFDQEAKIVESKKAERRNERAMKRRRRDYEEAEEAKDAGNAGDTGNAGDYVHDVDRGDRGVRNGRREAGEENGLAH